MTPSITRSTSESDPADRSPRGGSRGDARPGRFDRPARSARPGGALRLVVEPDRRPAPGGLRPGIRRRAETDRARAGGDGSLPGPEPPAGDEPGARTWAGPSAWLAAGSLALFVVGVTWISRSETETGRTGGAPGRAVAPESGVPGAGGRGAPADRSPGRGRSRPRPARGLLVLLPVGFIVNRAGPAPTAEPVPSTFQRAVKTGVLSLVWLDVARRWRPRARPRPGRGRALDSGLPPGEVALLDLNHRARIAKIFEGNTPGPPEPLLVPRCVWHRE